NGLGGDFPPSEPPREPDKQKLNEKEQLVIRCYRILLFPILFVSFMFVGPPASQAQAAAGNPDVLVIDATAPAHPFPHFWEHIFGSGRASLSLRESYRQDLRQVKKITDVEYVRFHAI